MSVLSQTTPLVAYPSMGLTNRQIDNLHVVRDYGPVTARDLSYHLLMDASAARGMLGRLESRGLVEARYTGLRAGQRGRAYTITEAGEVAVLAALRGDGDV